MYVQNHLAAIFSNCVCVSSNADPTALLRAWGSAQGGLIAVVYFQFMHRLGRPHYVWDEYLNSVLGEVEVKVTVCRSVCVV